MSFVSADNGTSTQLNLGSEDRFAPSGDRIEELPAADRTDKVAQTIKKARSNTLNIMKAKKAGRNKSTKKLTSDKQSASEDNVAAIPTPEFHSLTCLLA